MSRLFMMYLSILPGIRNNHKFAPFSLYNAAKSTDTQLRKKAKRNKGISSSLAGTTKEKISTNGNSYQRLDKSIKQKREDAYMEISRRNFIKASGGLAAFGMIGTGSLNRWIRPAAAEGAEEEKIAYTFHPPNCGGRCSMKCTVRKGKLVKIEPNEWPDGHHKKVCLRGLSEVERVYSPDRLKTPLKRVGERGEGKFVAISWDEALTTIADKLTEIKGKYGGKSILWSNSSGVQYPMSTLAALIGAQEHGALDFGIDMSQAGGQSIVMGPFNITNTNEITDWVNSNLVLLVGNNLLETSLTDAAFFFDAKEKGTKMVCIDPVFSTTAAKCDQWIPLRPGTDSALYLGMIHLVLNNQWYDQEYVRSYTSAPFLIREDNQRILRDEGNNYLVWDKNSDSPRPVDAPGILPELEGEFTVNGVKVKTVLTAFTEHIRQYTPAWAAKVTEIPEEVITDLTREYALGGPASIQWGLGGPDKWYHSDTTGRLATILAGLTGNIGRVGGGVGQGTQHVTCWSWVTAMGSWDLPPEFAPAPAEVPFSDIPTASTSIKAFFFQGNMLHQMIPDYNTSLKWADSLEFIAVVDNQHCDSVNYADIVLPACSSFESEYDIAYLINERNHILLQQKVIEPLFESKSDFQIEKELAQKLGLDQYLPETPEDYVRALLNSPDPALQGITVEALKANQCIMRLNVPDQPYVAYLDRVFGTESTKLEFYNELFLEDHCAFPVWEEPNEASPANPLYQKYPLMLGSPHARFRAHSTFSNARWLLQINNEPLVRINPIDAQARGIQNKEFVEVFNDRGSFQCRCQIVNDMRPGMVQLSEGWWSRYFQKGDLQEVTNPNKNPRGKKLLYGPIVAFLDTLVEVKKVEG
ncbi:molybdopterin-dependent oxidoreductase [Desulfitobacterium hafniense]|uniref:Dehydrogenase n=6 Tax=root TaxID=1 RepID=A0A0W1JP46_DESHA|nr:molybdopterin-dependent oxidoreductase [Desulfitobacterium hafniense]KTE92952.1 dehydrogenase [Desulfitobacterium hafniense]MEA5023824.1 molybdopterin-dependent oxidoreductase [Desulfitobacterium hafniense]BAE82316.1 putative anaerobic dehydrogenase [Desulfitobacterium hafniense Y51]